ncbi:MAG: hypothetical protein JRG82_18645, partial [Deltaproteobacteria bacterium]|nr:hypothetical protein [Deltaproteobacteria bacterium]
MLKLANLTGIVSKMGGAVAAVGLLACIVFSGPVNATTFTLAELIAPSGGPSFVVGNLEFSDWSSDLSTVNTNIVTVTTIDDPDL